MKILDGMVIRPVGDRIVAIPTGEAIKAFSGFVELNRTANVIWQGIEKGLSAKEIAQKFSEQYADITCEAALAEVNRVIAELAEEGIVLLDE